MNIEYRAIKILVGISPFAAAFIPAYFLYQNTQRFLDMPAWAALITAFAAESIGASAITVYYKAKQHNAYYSADKNQVPASRALWAFGIYLLSILTVNAVIEQTILASIAKGLLSLMSLAGALLLSVHYQIGQVKERYVKKKETETVQKPPKEIQKPLQFDVSNVNELSEEMKAVLKNGHSIKELCEIFPKVSERTIYNWKETV